MRFEFSLVFVSLFVSAHAKSFRSRAANPEHEKNGGDQDTNQDPSLTGKSFISQWKYFITRYSKNILKVHSTYYIFSCSRCILRLPFQTKQNTFLLSLSMKVRVLMKKQVVYVITTASSCP